MTLTLDIPPETVTAKLVKAAVALYDARLLSQGQAAEMAALSRAEFIDALGREGVAVFRYDSVEELLAETSLDVTRQPAAEFRSRLLARRQASQT